MTIHETGVGAFTVGALLATKLRIPPYQRPYSWEPATALQLFDDIRDALNDPERRDMPYVLGAVILHQSGQDLDVVDGQQRLLTLHMILQLLETDSGSGYSGQPDNPVGRVRNAILRHTVALPPEERPGIARFIRDCCQLVRVVTDDIDEAFRVFDSQNYRGKPLAPHDLLKAHHLREMRDETAAMKAAVVETWESVGDSELDRLFSTYLYRIARWSRGESAPKFRLQDIGLFKGISPRTARSPGARYHVAAQVALPMLSAWGVPGSAADDRDAGRSRFQLDVPLLAGRAFFEMVAFMLAELVRVAREGFRGREAFSLYDLSGEDGQLNERPSGGRYRFVSELYVAALLYYTSRFGDEDLPAAQEQLFAWAYALRVELLRVQFRSADNRARGDASAFVLMRDAGTGRAIRRLGGPGQPYSDDHEKKLVGLLNGWER